VKHVSVFLLFNLLINSTLAIDSSLDQFTVKNSCSRIINLILRETYYNEAAAIDIRQVFLDLTGMDSATVAGHKVPSNQDLDNLEITIDRLSKFNERYIFINEYEKHEFIRRVFLVLYARDKKVMNFILAVNKTEGKTPSDLSELAKISSLRKMTEEINAFFPAEFRLKLTKLKLEKHHKAILQQAKELVEKQSEIFNQYIHTSGYSSYEDIRKINTKNKEELGDIVDLVRKEELVVAINRPESARWWIPKVGLHNQHSTGTSLGYKGVKGRNSVEASLTEMSYQKYSQLDKDLRPKYGYLRPKIESDYTSIDVKSYGDDSYILDLEKIQNRLTWSPGDSLNRLNTLDNQWILENTKKYKKWDLVFLPWSAREMMIPLLSKKLKADRELGLNMTSIDLPKSHENLQMGLPQPRADYIETQVWGPVRLDEVKQFIFTNNPPSLEYAAKLESYGISIFDGRVSPPKKFNYEEALAENKLEEIKTIQITEKKAVRVFTIRDKILPLINLNLQAYRPPIGTLSKLGRSFGESEMRGSTMPNWWIDEKGVNWLLKEDIVYPELQTAAEVISSSIYRHLGINAPEAHIINIDGKRYAAIRSLGKDLMASTLEKNQSSKWKQVFFIAALLKDYDRIYSAKNNFELNYDEFAIFDFGGTLGSKARGEHKKVWPGWEVHSDATGMFENTQDIEVVFTWFKDRFKPLGHAWNNVTKEDALSAVKNFKNLTDEDIERFVKRAHYTKKSDQDFMISALKNRRDSMIKYLLDYFEN
jgi:hypothetical protein